MQHQTLTTTSKIAAHALARRGIVVHPGWIDGSGRRSGDIRIKILVERQRVLITIAGHGVQQLTIYGPVLQAEIIDALEAEFTKVTIYDPYGLWAAQATRSR